MTAQETVTANIESLTARVTDLETLISLDVLDGIVSYGQDLFLAKAKLTAWQSVLKKINKGRDHSEVMEEFTDYLLDSSTATSTSPMSNLKDQCQVKALQDTIKKLRYIKW
jgi:hypothetical protein